MLRTKVVLIGWLWPGMVWPGILCGAAWFCVAAKKVEAEVEVAPKSWEAECRQMVDREVAGAGVRDERVLQAVLRTPRHEFVALAHRPYAYFDMALPIGKQQTISSPFIVAYMTEAVAPQPTDRVLEVGTGSGYQAAILSPLVQDVYSVEIIRPLADKASQTLNRLGYKNVHVKIGDGFAGWPEHAPFDKIMVTCSPEHVPQPLVDQLKEGGRMVIPVGERYQQTLYLMRKEQGKLVTESLRPTLFVPMTGRADLDREQTLDSSRVVIVNHDMEAESSEADAPDDPLPGWYYQRQVRLVRGEMSPQGLQHATFHNQLAGRSSHALQGLALDGRQFPKLRFAAWISSKDVEMGPEPTSLPKVAVTFYDQDRRQTETVWLGPFKGTQPWRRVERTVRVPPESREAIVRVGLFGATGEFSVDEIVLAAP